MAYRGGFGEDTYAMTVFILMLLFVGVIVSVFFVSCIPTALASVFLYYCLDRRFREIGVTVPGTPVELRNMESDPVLNRNPQDGIVPYSA